MRTPKYYRELGFTNFSKGDPNEPDDVYPIWCASIFHCSDDMDRRWDLVDGLSKYVVTINISKEASLDIIRALKGYRVDEKTYFEAFGNYAVVIFNASVYIGKLVEGVSDASICYSDRYDRAIPIECGKVSYGGVLKNHPKLYKADDRFRYQREYRIRPGIKIKKERFDKELNLKDHGVFDRVMDGIEVYDRETIIRDYENNGYITFQHTYTNTLEPFN